LVSANTNGQSDRSGKADQTAQILPGVAVDAAGLSAVLQKRVVAKLTHWNNRQFGFAEIVSSSLAGMKMFVHIKRVFDNDGNNVKQSPKPGSFLAAYNVRLRYNPDSNVRTLCAEWFTGCKM
jgi:hypothetical protein